jgi:hypothetical protein
MDHLFDEFSKSLAEPVPRRESLRRLGAVFAGAVLTPLGVGTAWAGGYLRRDPCKEFCKCRNWTKQNQCLAACKACGGDTSRLAGSCGNYTCCAVAACHGVCSDLSSDPDCGACGNDCRSFNKTCCGGNYCADLAGDFYNCGSCGNVCGQAGPNEYGACVGGNCVYDCLEGTVDCNGACSYLDSDPDNCGACGNVCPASAPACFGGTCHECSNNQTNCGGYCADLGWDPGNCGACGFVCPNGQSCELGLCSYYDPGSPNDWPYI